MPRIKTIKRSKRPSGLKRCLASLIRKLTRRKVVNIAEK